MIEVNNLTQIYPSGKGIFNISFSIKKGSVYGCLGPNGAGKTTMIRNILGFANAKAGSATIKGMEFLRFIGDLRGLKETKRRDELIERFELDATGKLRKMSKGMKQKVAIVAAFMHEPEIYILDEPTSGLDPLMQNRFLDLLDEEKGRGSTILMSSHVFDEIQRSCDYVGIIREGKMVADETVLNITAMKEDNYVIKLRDVDSVNMLMNSHFNGELVGQKKVQLTVKQNYNEFFELLSSVNVIGLEAKQQSLENVFMKYYGKEGSLNE